MGKTDIREQNIDESKPAPDPAADPPAAGGAARPPAPLPPEVGGAPGPDPTRYGDWQHKGRVTDF